MKLRVSIPWIALMFAGCSGGVITNELPPSSELGGRGSYRVARALIHSHTPWSYDACDTKGTNAAGEIDETCLAHLRTGLCKNHIDFAFMTDHNSHMSERTIEELLLKREADVLIDGNTANWMQDCGDGQRPITFAGLEGQILGVGMTTHADKTLYEADTAAAVTSLASVGTAIIPHTEKWSVANLSTLVAAGLKGIEVFNLHAQLDPKIRRAYLGLEPFQPSLDVLPYWLDPLQVEQPDLAFMAIGVRPTLYEQKWDELLSAGSKVFGTAATDAHENLFPGTTRDGERIDSFRRLMRWVSNHLLVATASSTEAKAAMAAGRFSLVFEAVGSPVGATFYAEVNGTAYDMGSTVGFVSGQTRLKMGLPTLHPKSPRGNGSPVLRLRILKVASTGAVQVAEATDAALDYTVTAAGTYRAEIKIKPRHLADYLTYDHARTEEEYTWVLFNPIYLP